MLKNEAKAAMDQSSVTVKCSAKKNASQFIVPANVSQASQRKRNDFKNAVQDKMIKPTALGCHRTDDHTQ